MWRVVISRATGYTISILLLDNIAKAPRHEMVLAPTHPLIHNPGAPSLNPIHLQLNPKNSQANLSEVITNYSRIDLQIGREEIQRSKSHFLLK